MSGSLDGPLGPLRGMFWDPIRSKYFPNPRPSASTRVQGPEPHPTRAQSPTSNWRSPTSRRQSPGTTVRSLAASSSSRPREGRQDTVGIRNTVSRNPKHTIGGQAGPRPDQSDVSDSMMHAQTPKPRLRFVRSRMTDHGHKPHMDSAEKGIWSQLALWDTKIYFREHEVITHIHANWNGDFDYLVFTQQGSLEARNRGSEPYRVPYYIDPWIHPTFDQAPKGFSIRGSTHCLAPFVYHTPDSRFISIFQQPISKGPSRPNTPQRYHPMPSCFSTFEKSVTVGSGPSVIKFDFSQDRPSQAILRASVSSDVLAVHQVCDHTVYAGLRNSVIGCGDFRTPNGIVQQFASTGQKAITSVQRLQDSAVPFGLLASGMGDQLLIFDIRFGDRPLKELSGHVNSFYSDLGMTTTIDGKILFAGGSDHRIRAWSLVDGQRLVPSVVDHNNNPLNFRFPDRPTAISVREDGVMDVAVGGSVWRFGIPGRQPNDAHSD